MTDKFIHSTALVEEDVIIGGNSKIWHNVQIRKNAKIGKDVSIGKSTFVDSNVVIGDGSRIQNSVNIYDGVSIGKWCFVGPSVVFTNDQFPRVGNKSWTRVETILENCCSIGAGAVIRCGITLGAFSMIGAGAIVTKSVPPFTLVLGFPAEERKKICACGQNVFDIDTDYVELIRNCCKENMSNETYELAQKEMAFILNNSLKDGNILVDSNFLLV